MHSVRANVDETVERSEPGRTAAVSRESEGQETRDPNGRRRRRHIRLLLVSDTGERPHDIYCHWHGVFTSEQLTLSNRMMVS